MDSHFRSGALQGKAIGADNTPIGNPVNRPLRQQRILCSMPSTLETSSRLGGQCIQQHQQSLVLLALP
jgi:hypothetical protein